jgi:ATP-dependent helicase/DNAse subunit B
LLTLTKEQIKKTTDSIRQGNFVIAPKVFGNGRLPCLYCPCKDICFTTPDDIITIVPSTPAQDEGDDEEEEA